VRIDRRFVKRLSRRQFLATAAGGLAAAAGGDALLVEPTAIDISRHDVVVPGLPPGLAGLRIAQLTDLHLHGGIHATARAALVLLARERPDVVVLVGDICNRDTDLPWLVAWAKDARGTLATYATYGNWEHYAEIDRATAESAYARAGVEFLCNSAATLRVGDATLALLGLDDPVEGHPDLGATLAGADGARAGILLLHGPGYVDTIPRDTAPAPALLLAGHTHGGQIRLPFWSPYLPAGSGRFVAGWYRDTLAPLYVSRGLGTIVVRARLFCRPELPIFTLRAG